jgi:hypothetical protein
MGSSSRDTTASAPDCQPSVVRPGGNHHERWALQQFIFELFGQPHSARRRRLGIKDGKVDCTRGHLTDDCRLRRGIDEIQWGRATLRQPPEGLPHSHADVRVTAVDQHAKGGVQTGST